MSAADDHEATMIPLGQCRVRGVYLLRSRNLSLGAFDGVDGFIGIREKFNARYLFTEHHWELGAAGFGTARPLREIGIVPEPIELRERVDPFCSACRRPVAATSEPGPDRFHADGSPICAGAHGRYATYQPLFDYLDRIETSGPSGPEMPAEQQ